jgi:hypothetical protein
VPEKSERKASGTPEADLVLEGGRVKGLGTAGAVMALLDAGYTFPRAVGDDPALADDQHRSRCRSRSSR